ncbi:acyl carrier protein [Hyphococcus sp.]|jgi:acyl carrier protein|uniref:acyl carrier protein n=1 Tax=Hyphococcus sp. TaxID=2038636 RepID=UPI003D0ADCE2
MAELEPTLLEIIKDHAVGLTGELNRDTPIADLGIDSFSVVEIIYEVEEKLGVEVPFNANENPFGDMSTVGELVDALDKLIKK